jgi:hypothetical protein
VRSSPPSADPPTLPASIDLKPQSAVVVTRQLDDLFSPEVTYDLGDFGLGVVQGIDAIRDAAIAMVIAAQLVITSRMSSSPRSTARRYARDQGDRDSGGRIQRQRRV